MEKPVFIELTEMGFLEDDRKVFIDPSWIAVMQPIEKHFIADKWVHVTEILFKNGVSPCSVKESVEEILGLIDAAYGETGNKTKRKTTQE